MVEVIFSGSDMASKTEVSVLVDWALYVLNKGSDRETRFESVGFVESVGTGLEILLVPIDAVP